MTKISVVNVASPMQNMKASEKAETLPFSRRALLAGLLPIAAFARTQIHPLNIGPNPTTGTLLILTDNKGAAKQTLGYVIAMPQACRASRPDGSSNYGSPEWIKEITYIANVDKVSGPKQAKQAKALLSPYRLGNDQHSAGCGAASMNVTVTKIVLDKSPAGYHEEHYPEPNSNQLYYSLVSGGGLQDQDDVTSTYLADSLWISSEAWDTSITAYKAAIARPRIGTCPA
jgi:hypothetical protein